MIHTWLKRSILAGLFFVPFIPMIVSSGMFFPFITGKNFAFRIVVEIVLALWVILALRNPAYRPKRSLIVYGFVAFVGVTALADFQGENFFRSFWSNYERMEGLIAHLHFIAYFFVLISVLKTEELWKRYFHTTMAVSFFLCVFGMLQLCGVFNINQGSVRLDATLGNAAYLAIYLLFTIFITAIYTFKSSEKGSEVTIGWTIVGAHALLFGYAIYLTGFFSLGSAVSASLASRAMLYWFFLSGLLHVCLFVVSRVLAARKDKKFPRQLALGLGAVHAAVLAFSYFLTGAVAFGTTVVSVGTVVALGAVASALLYAGLLLYKGDKKRYLAGALYGELLVFQGAVLYFTATRGAILGLIGGVVLSALAIGYSKKGVVRNIAFGIVGCIVALFIAFLFVKDTVFVKSSPVLVRFTSFKEATITSREYIWAMSFRGFKERPLLGWGQENYNVVFNKFYDPRLYTQEQWFDRAHNVFLDWLVAGGVLGLLGYLSLFGAALYLLLNPHRSDFSLYDRSLIFGLLMGYFAQNLTVFDNLISYILFFTVLAYIHVRAEGAEHVTGKVAHGRTLPLAAQWTLGTLAVVGLASAMYFVNIKPIAASKTLITAISPQQGGPAANLEAFKQVFAYDTLGNSEAREQLMIFAGKVLSDGNVPENVRRDVGTYALEQMSKQVELTPTDARYRLFLGSFLRLLGPNVAKEAEEQLLRAVELSPGKQALWIELGSLYLGNKDLPRALEAMKHAHELDTSYEEARKIYGLTAIYAGDYKLAESILVPAFGTIAIDDDRFVTAFNNRADSENLVKIWSARVEANRQDPRNLTGLGFAYLMAKQTASARAVFKEAIAIQPDLKAQIESQAKITIY